MSKAPARKRAERQRTTELQRTTSTAEARAARLAAIQAARQPDSSSASLADKTFDTTFADDSFDVDDDFIQHIEAVEAAALARRS